MPKTILGASLIVSLAALSSTVSIAQTAHQGDPNSGIGSTDFHSPMVLDTIFAPADRALWDKGGWFTVKEYQELGRFTCDGVSLRSDYDRRKGTWDAGLEMAVKPLDDGKVRVKIRAIVYNPKHNHDKRVSLYFEIQNGDQRVETATMPPIKAEDKNDDFDGEVSVVVSADALKTDPMTRLRITMTTVDD
jgi:hypothetical protein